MSEHRKFVMRSGALAALVAMAACSPIAPTPESTATERELCRVWFDSIPTRSQSDTAQTRLEVQTAIDVWDEVCGSIG